MVNDDKSKKWIYTIIVELIVWYREQSEVAKSVFSYANFKNHIFVVFLSFPPFLEGYFRR